MLHFDKVTSFVIQFNINFIDNIVSKYYFTTDIVLSDFLLNVTK